MGLSLSTQLASPLGHQWVNNNTNTARPITIINNNGQSLGSSVTGWAGLGWAGLPGSGHQSLGPSGSVHLGCLGLAGSPIMSVWLGPGQLSGHWVTGPSLTGSILGFNLAVWVCLAFWVRLSMGWLGQLSVNNNWVIATTVSLFVNTGPSGLGWVTNNYCPSFVTVNWVCPTGSLGPPSSAWVCPSGLGPGSTGSVLQQYNTVRLAG